MSTNQPRRPVGTPVGGQWAPSRHAEADVELSPPAGRTVGQAGWKPVKVIEVIDTRTYEEGPDDRWHPVPGSGTVNQCDRCGKDHEVHVVVEDGDGHSHVVGSSCAHADGPLAKRMASVVSATQKLAALRGQLAVAEAYWAKRSAAEAELGPKFPGWDESPAPSLVGPADPRAVVWATKDGFAKVRVLTYPDEARPEWEQPADWERRRRDAYDERERCLRDAWLRNLVVQEVGPAPSTTDVTTLKADVARTEARLVVLKDKAGKEHGSLEQMAANVVKRSGIDPRDKKAVYTEEDLAPHIGKTVTVAPKPGKVMSSRSRYYKGPVTGTLHSVWKDRNGNVMGFRLARAGGGGATEVEEFGNRGHATLEVVGEADETSDGLTLSASMT